ncbi:hypothetical protein GCM10023085_40990 [Actinomadura viridis]|uniref:DinB family protein n=1 Tax=Actinomadura viridis TaxID=58110 RepID=A0A931DRG8_9ACTN|nr:hypothetical protein [Actinomadura viridis]MBG6092622.1 hypothetical protein [Actinomadura viridis]
MEDWGSARYGDPCRECGYDWSITHEAAIDLVGTIPQLYTELLGGHSPTLRHPDLEWTAGAYICHVTDNLRIWAERLVSAALTGDAAIHGYDDVLLSRARAYNLLPVSGALWSLRLAVEAWTQAMDLAIESEVVLAHPERGAQPARNVARTNAHDAHHHGWDIKRTVTYHTR